MAQHDYNIANASGSSVRSDLNNALSAIATRNSGSSAPSTTFAYQPWVDTTSGTIKHRNAANSGWILDATADEAFVLSRSSNTMLDISDMGKTVLATSTFTQTFDAAATLGDGWFVNYRNNGTGLITFDPNSAETIDGATVINLHPGEGCRIYSNGSNIFTVGRRSYVAKRKTADETVASSTALQDDDHLQLSIGVNEEWVIYFDITTNSIGAGGIKSSVNAPSGATIDVSGYHSSGATTDGFAGGTQTIDAAWLSRVPGGGSADNAKLLVRAWILNGANAGTVVLRFAQNTSNASGVTFKKGSSMMAYRVES